MSGRPGRFLTAEWRSLLMINYVCDPELLRPLVPSGTELDSWQGRTFVSMVGFRFLRTNVLGIPVPFHRDFDEVNLRFYVRRVVAGEVRRGVVFVREIVPKGLIAFVARTVYNEQYISLPMKSESELPGRLRYSWFHRGEWHSLRGTTIGEPRLTEPDEEATFITEHYWGYAAQADGGTMEYEVEHPRWRVWSIADPTFTSSITRLYGAAFVPILKAKPSSAFVADGSAVTVRRGRRISPETVDRPV